MKKILMLGWEYPPHISGGLGTACEGLTKALARAGVQITFIVPKLYGGEISDHMLLLDPELSLQMAEDAAARNNSIRQISIPAFLQPYWTDQQFKDYQASSGQIQRQLGRIRHPKARQPGENGKVVQYGDNIFKEVSRYTSAILGCVGHLEFDLIHAHDWMTYPAGVALAQMTGKPLIVHVHSLEYDRSVTGDPRILDIERLGVNNADIVVAVSYYTRAVISKVHDVPLEKIMVVHNGIYPTAAIEHYRSKELQGSKIVLFLGRITYQKGPEYFVEAAAKVIPHVPDVLFVMAGSGDMLPKVRSRVQNLGMGKHFLFPGFLRGRQVEEMFTIADLYVMPSVSEPFGLSALEAVNFDTPALISKQSGVAEVLFHSLKFDFWDVDRLADLIINALNHREMRNDMIYMAKEELKKIRWDASAVKTMEVYDRL
jgi:glycosyltransferase involved in cell wall biosynthesis